MRQISACFYFKFMIFSSNRVILGTLALAPIKRGFSSGLSWLTLPPISGPYLLGDSTSTTSSLGSLSSRKIWKNSLGSLSQNSLQALYFSLNWLVSVSNQSSLSLMRAICSFNSKKSLISTKQSLASLMSSLWIRLLIKKQSWIHPLIQLRTEGKWADSSITGS